MKLRVKTEQGAWETWENVKAVVADKSKTGEKRAFVIVITDDNRAHRVLEMEIPDDA